MTGKSGSRPGLSSTFERQVVGLLERIIEQQEQTIHTMESLGLHLGARLEDKELAAIVAKMTAEQYGKKT